MTANDMQVGGTFYRTDYPHWDLVISIPLSYLEGNSTKYVTRWRKKGEGLQDLRKALHFLTKIEEDAPTPPKRALTYVETISEIARFSAANGLSPEEKRFVEVLSTWESVEDLMEARQLLFVLLDQVEKVVPGGPVPLTEENHHAERVGRVSDAD